jgi:hypothetical protein
MPKGSAPVKSQKTLAAFFPTSKKKAPLLSPSPEPSSGAATDDEDVTMAASEAEDPPLSSRVASDVETSSQTEDVDEEMSAPEGEAPKSKAKRNGKASTASNGTAKSKSKAAKSKTANADSADEEKPKPKKSAPFKSVGRGKAKAKKGDEDEDEEDVGSYGWQANLPPMHDIPTIFSDIVRRFPELLKLSQLVKGRKLRVATMCSGTESPLLALDLISKKLKEDFDAPLEFHHVFSCEIEPFKQAYIERNFSPPILFRDVCELGQTHAYVVWCLQYNIQSLNL